MKLDLKNNYRKTIRLKDYDYSQAGAYFVTICTYNREYLFGEIVGEKMLMNGFGRIAYDEWFNTLQIRSNVELDKFVVMPNHVHGIIIINCRGVLQYAPTSELRNNHEMDISRCHHTPKFRSPSQTIGAIVRGYKSAVTKKIGAYCNTPLLRNTPKTSVWQRAYYEHVIRNEDDLNQVREYIINNPLKWELDRENPNNIGKL